MSDALITRAHAMGGVLAPTDIADAGLRSRDVAALVHDGTLLRVAPRAYVLDEAMAAAQTPEQRHRLEAMARVHSFAGRVVASHHSALALHGLPFWRVNTGVFHVARAKGTSSRRRGDLVVHEAYPEEISGGAFTSLLRSPATGIAAVRPVLAVIGTALTDGEDAGVVAADAALHRGLMSVEECEAWLGALARRPHLGLARRALSQAEPLTESVGETRTRLLLRSMPGLASITPQFPFRDHPDEEPWAFSDFLVGRRLVVEFDGRLKYRAGYGATTAEVEEIVWREKRREDRIRRHDGGKVVVRVVWDDLDSPSRFRAMIREGLRQVDALPAAA